MTSTTIILELAAKFIVDYWDPGARLSAWPFVRTSYMARLRPRGLGFAVALYTWASRGETLVPTLAAQTVLRVS